MEYDLIDDDRPIAVTRFGRIRLSTGLFERFRPQLVQAILAHEEGHVKFRHEREYIALCLIQFLALSFIPVALMLSHWSVVDAAILMAYSLAWFVLMRNILRAHNHACEFEADQYACAQGFGRELAEVIGMVNKPETACHSHPAPAERIRRIEACLHGETA